MPRPLTREDWNDPSRLQRRDGVPVDECCYFDAIENTGREQAFAAAGGWARSYFSDGTYQRGRVSAFDIILKPEIEAADNMADAEMEEQQSGEIDWSDVTKLQARDGGDVSRVLVLPDWVGNFFPVCVEMADGRVWKVKKSGRFGHSLDWKDIIPKPQPKPEPRSVEAWVHPGLFVDGGRYWASTNKDKVYNDYVKVRITEVVE